MAIIKPFKLELVVDADDTDSIVECIRQAASTDKIGDGKIFVFPVEEAISIRVRTGERGKEAIWILLFKYVFTFTR